jgi:hypothetical protein
MGVQRFSATKKVSKLRVDIRIGFRVACFCSGFDGVCTTFDRREINIDIGWRARRIRRVWPVEEN